MGKKKEKTVLLFSDMHIPYHHKDALNFLKAVKKKYNPDLVICGGDLIDNHAISFHDTDPELYSSSKEVNLQKDYIKKLIKLFPKLEITLGNHDLLMLRNFKKHGLPSNWLKSFHDVFGLPKTWKFHDELTIDLDSQNRLYIVHNKKKNTLKLAQEMGMSTAQAHYHTQFGVCYASNPDKLIFAIDMGCLVNRRSLAMAYLKSIKRPILGCVVIKGKKVIPIPMLISKKHSWIGGI